MICYDKLRLLIPMQCVTNIDYNKFQEKKEKNNITTYKYEMVKPYHLSIRTNPYELVVELSGKVLLDNYTYLINRNTIYECLENINNLKVIQLDIYRTIDDSEVLLCDVTKDFPGVMEHIKQYILLNIIDRLNWTLTTPKKNNNIILQNNVMTKRYKKRLTFYDKRAEMEKADNKDFLHSLNDPEEVLDYFDDNNIRVECNLKCKEQIRKMLNINDTKLINVIESEANPILAILTEAVRNIKDIDFNSTSEITTLKEFEKLSVIKSCGNSMLAVEQLVKSFNSKDAARKLKPYYEVFDKIIKNDMPRIDLHKLIS